jgi:hypothetical protein
MFDVFAMHYFDHLFCIVNFYLIKCFQDKKNSVYVD